jgi:hypothetical protein
MNYNHFIITRFNLKFPEIRGKKNTSPVRIPDDEWLALRTDYFMRYCLPSVLNQTSRNFKWLIYFDISTKRDFIQKFHELEMRHSQLMKIILADGYKSFTDRYLKDVLDLCDQNCKYVITTRLDNDDIIHKQFIAKVQENFHEQEFMAVNFVKILMLNPEDRRKLHIDYSFSNHFISIIEKINNGQITGCYGKGDREWNRKKEIIQITDKPYCIEIISGTNLLNCFRGLPVLKATDLSDFSLSGQSYRNPFFDPYNLKFWKMSWRKFFLYLRFKSSNNEN